MEQKEMPISLRFSLLHRTFKQQLDKRLSDYGLTGVQFGVLGQLARLQREGKDPITQKDLENASHLSHPTMTEILKRLEKNGFVRCCPKPDDRRYKIISLTQEAALLREEMMKTETAVMDWLCRDISPQERDAFLTVLDKLLGNVLACCPEKGSENENEHA